MKLQISNLKYSLIEVAVVVKLKEKLALSVWLLQDTCQAVICCALALNGADKLLNYEDLGALNDDC